MEREKNEQENFSCNYSAVLCCVALLCGSVWQCQCIVAVLYSAVPWLYNGRPIYNIVTTVIHCSQQYNHAH